MDRNSISKLFQVARGLQSNNKTTTEKKIPYPFNFQTAPAVIIRVRVPNDTEIISKLPNFNVNDDVNFTEDSLDDGPDGDEQGKERTRLIPLTMKVPHCKDYQ